jgi:hypothetical protein
MIMLDNDIVITFIIADRLHRESGLKTYERHALKRLYEKQHEYTQDEIRRSLGSKFVDEILGGVKK